MSRKKPELPPSGRGRKPSNVPPQDDPYWQHVLKTVTPYSARKKAAATKAPKSTIKPKTEKAPAKSAPTTTRGVTSAPPLRQPTPATAQKKNAGFDAATETKLRKGKLDIEGRLDLHGLSQKQAHEALHRFMRSALKRELRTLLIITGKGSMSDGGGVLRRMLPQWLEDGDLAPHVLALTPAAPKDGGGGAFYLRLRRKR